MKYCGALAGEASGAVVCAVATPVPRNTPLAAAPSSAPRREIDESLTSFMMNSFALACFRWFTTFTHWSFKQLVITKA